MGYLEGLKKYDDRGDFKDPVVRCDSCQKILLIETLVEFGMCSKCGNRKVTGLKIFSEEEQKEMQDMGVDPDFLALFAVKEER